MTERPGTLVRRDAFEGYRGRRKLGTAVNLAVTGVGRDTDHCAEEEGRKVSILSRADR